MSELDFQQALIELAHYRQWRVAAFRPARTDKGWRTPLSGDRGYPDLSLAREGRVIVAELKSSTGRLGPGQQEWAAALGDHYRLWRPTDLATITKELR